MLGDDRGERRHDAQAVRDVSSHLGHGLFGGQAGVANESLKGNRFLEKPREREQLLPHVARASHFARLVAEGSGVYHVLAELAHKSELGVFRLVHWVVQRVDVLGEEHALARPAALLEVHGHAEKAPDFTAHPRGHDELPRRGERVDGGALVGDVK